ncbi:MAG: DNA mismatch repair endonuclease MutL [Planctomycetota bacterium]|nr:DNA mismatch repair endonuclease MutL [Planctomycetota bacterium]
MGKIILLPETVRNKIAAGEVIERPASVVKELAENAIDAGARQVTVELEGGGHRLIRVSDDGCGMDEEDLVLSIQPHATSKIQDVDDIFRIATFGFRGEALPSIASVSRLSVTTCLEGGSEGREITVDGGRSVRLSPAPPRRGTRVEVRDIFFNTPARRKFLRQPSSENSRSGEILCRLALGNPGVAFRLQADNRIVLSAQPTASQLERAAEIFGREAARNLIPFDLDVSDGLAVSGFFAKPPRSVKNSREIYILINRRWIRCPALARAIGDAFQGTLPPREYPFAIVNLDLDPAKVDLNVHPAKEEVRFEREGLVIGGVKRAIREALIRLGATTTFTSLAGYGLTKSAASTHAAPEAESGVSATRLPAPLPGGNPRMDETGGQARLDLPARLAASRHSGFSEVDLEAMRDRLHPAADNGDPSLPAQTAASRPEPEPSRDSGDAGNGLRLGPAGQHRILGQAGGKYLLIDSPDGILLVDPHALHERWNFDRLREEKRRGAVSRRLLLPLDMHLNPAEAAAAVKAAPQLAEYGFEAHCPEPNRLRITVHPEFLPAGKVENLLRQVLADLGEAETIVTAFHDRLLASLACRSSVLLGHNLPEEEMLALLDRFFNQGQLPTCPHGRPTAIRIGWDELARRFGR